MTSTRRRALLVLGMHRSGTSAFTRVMSLLGAELPTSLMPAVVGNNDTGFWEPADIVPLHDEILASVGSAWDDVSAFPADWFASAAATPYKERLLACLEANFASAPLFVIKDPRVCRLVPLWREVLASFDTEPLIVLPVRHPLEVAASLTRRDGFPLGKGLLLWLRHLLAAERDSRDMARIVASYESLLRDWRGVMRRVGADLDLSWPRWTPEAEAEIDTFLSAGLRHHVASRADLDARPDVVGWIKAAYGQTLDLAEHPAELAAAFDGIAGELDIADALFGPAIADGRRDLAKREREMAGLCEEVSRLNGEILDRERGINQLGVETSRLNGEIVNRDRGIAFFEGEVARLNGEIVNRDRGIAFFEGEVARLNGEIADRDRGIAHLNGEIAYFEAEVGYLGDEITALDGEIARLNGEVAWRDERIAALLNSASWRVTAPLRKTVGMVRRVRRLRPGRIREVLRERGLHGLAAKAAASVAEAPPPAASSALKAVLAATLALGRTPAPRFTDELAPQVSVIVPTGGGGEDAVLATLVAVQAQGGEIAFEMLVADDGANPATTARLAEIPGLRHVRADGADLGQACNAAVAEARGEFVALLLPGTLPLPGWLAALTETFQRFPDTGLAGARRLTADGRLREAGGRLGGDGSLKPFGGDALAEDGRFGHVRVVDTCSLGGIMVPRRLWQEAGGFDASLVAPGLIEADLALRLRRLGHPTRCQAFAQVVEAGDGVPHGDPARERLDRQTFRKRWALASQRREAGGGAVLPHTPEPPRVLFIDVATPTPDQDSGSWDIYEYMRIFLGLGYAVTFLPAAVTTHAGRYTEDLQRIGVECIYAPFLDTAQAWLEREAVRFDLVMLYRAPIAAWYLGLIRHCAPRVKVVFDTVDLHYLREEREAELLNSAEKREQAARTRAAELAAIEQADCTILLSQKEMETVAGQLPAAKLRLIPIVRPIPGRLAPAAGRAGVVFIGGFNHQPNVDAVVFLAGDIWPRVRRMLPDARLTIIGSNPTPAVEALAAPDQGIVVAGFVADLTETFRTCRLTVAPLRYGAGIKGKVVSSLSYGVPCVATSVAVEGMGLTDGVHAAVADDPEAFAAAIVRLHTDEAQWLAISEGGLALAHETFSIDKVRDSLAGMLASLGLPAGAGAVVEAPPFEAVRIASFAEDQKRVHSQAFRDTIASRLAVEGGLTQPDGFMVPGYCAVCRRPTQFWADWEYAHHHPDGTSMPNWRERLVCTSCQLNSRMRAALHFLEASLRPRPDAAFYATEQVTPLFQALKQRYPNTIGSEYFGDRIPFGSCDAQGIRNEDVTRLTFADEAFDAILSFDVFEHVPRWEDALAECRRCLKPGGLLLFSVPFFRSGETNVIRARLTGAGEIEHLLPPEYHGNPVDPEKGALCFHTFGWELLDRLRAIGYMDVAAHFFWSLELGYLGEEQMLFLAVKESS